MPLYCYTCPCGKTREVLRPVSECDKPHVCPCGKESKRDFPAESRATRVIDGGVRYSEALGLNPDQIPEYRKQYPHHEFTPDGRMIIRGYQHQKRVLKELGFVDRS